MIIALVSLLALAVLLVLWALFTLGDRPRHRPVPAHAWWTTQGPTTRLWPDDIPADQVQPLRLPGYLE